MPRLIRRKTFTERLQAYFNPYDFLLWLSEEIETREWDDNNFANPFGAALNFIFLLARANSGRSRTGGDDVFGDVNNGSGWLGWISALTVYSLTLLSVANAAYTFLRKRHYRLFENAIDDAPGTPSAQRVRVDSSPVSPDPIREVWELAVWDPIPSCLRLFCLFSPGHVLVYWLFLPVSQSDPRPSVTVATAMFLVALLSAQLLFFQSYFKQQAKDTSIVHRQVLNEYDIKYVHPSLHPQVRDVGIQLSDPDCADANEIITYTPTTILRRGFKTNPNPMYAKFLPQPTAFISSSIFETPANYNRRDRDSTPLRTSDAAIRQPQFRQSTSSGKPVNTTTRDGGSLGVYSHANSPLKKASSMYDMQGGRRDVPKNSFQAAQREITEERERSASPAKKLNQLERGDTKRRTSVPPGYVLQNQSSRSAFASDNLNRRPEGHL